MSRTITSVQVRPHDPVYPTPPLHRRMVHNVRDIARKWPEADPALVVSAAVKAELHCRIPQAQRHEDDDDGEFLVGAVQLDFLPPKGFELWTPCLPGIEEGTQQGAPGQHGCWQVVRCAAWVGAHSCSLYVEVHSDNDAAEWMVRQELERREEARARAQVEQHEAERRERLAAEAKARADRTLLDELGFSEEAGSE